MDQDSLTGFYDPLYYHDLGVDYQIIYYPLYFGNAIAIIEYSTDSTYTVPYTINGTTISYSIPLSYLGNNDDEMDLLAISGHPAFGFLDWAPDEGHVTLLRDVFWLSENPNSGTIPPGGNMTIEISANTAELIGGNYLAYIDIQNNDPDNPVVEIPFAMHVTGIPQIVVLPDSLNFGETNLGYYNSLSLSISSTGTDSLFGNITSSDPQFILLDSSFALSIGEVKNIEVQFHPASIGTFNSELTINSNASPTPQIISLSGIGVIAPNITTNVNHFEFHSNSGDTITSSFVIYNSGGSDLVVNISDEVTNGTSNSERLFSAGLNMIYEINQDNGQIINSFPSPVATSDGPTGLAFSGEYLFFMDPFFDYFIFVLDPENGSVINSFGAPSISIDALAYVHPYLYAGDYAYSNIYVLDPTNGTIINTLYPPVSIGGGIDGGNNRLFASDFLNMIYELNPEDGSVINSFSPVNDVYGLGFTGKKLFSSFPSAGIDEYDPDTGNFIRTISTTGYAALAGGGNGKAEWLSEDPQQVTIAAGDSASINLLIIAPDESGQYTADIILESNDPDSSITRVQVVLDIVTSIAEENSLPTVYSLYNNYPNPFNPSTSINYDLPNQSNVKLKIYNILGEDIATLVNQEQNAGRYQVHWDASRLASGIYFYTIQAGDFVQTKKMILMK